MNNPVHLEFEPFILLLSLVITQSGECQMKCERETS